MSENILKISFLFSAVNRMGSTLSRLGSGLDKLSDKSERFNRIGKNMMLSGGKAMGVMLAGIGLAGAKFADLEKGQIMLENALLKSNGQLDENFTKIDRVARQLGTRLPGSTSDFHELAVAMIMAGSASESLANGALEAAANLGAVLDIPYAQAGEYISVFQNSLGIADRDLVKFADTVHRTAYMNVNLQDMQYAFAKMTGSLRTFGWQGIDSAEKLTPLLAMILRTGRSGEEVGTALSNIFNIGLTEGLFSDFEGMMRYFDKLGELDARTRTIQLQNLFGKGGAADIAGIIAQGGLAEYDKVLQKMREGASLNQKSERSLRGLSAAWEALQGTLDNVLAAFGSIFGKEAKAMLDKLNAIAEATEKWANENRSIVNIIAKVTFGAIGLWIVWGAGMRILAFSIGVMKTVRGAIIGIQTALAAAKTMSVIFSTVFGISMNAAKIAMISTGIGALVVGLGIGAVLLVQHWDKVKAFFIGLWDALKPKLKPIFDFFQNWWEMAKGVAGAVGKVFGKGGGAVRTVSPRGPALAGGSSLNYAPVVNINGSANRDDIRQELRRHKMDIYQMTESERRRAARRGY